MSEFDFQFICQFITSRSSWQCSRGVRSSSRGTLPVSLFSNIQLSLSKISPQQSGLTPIQYTENDLDIMSHFRYTVTLFGILAHFSLYFTVICVVFTRVEHFSSHQADLTFFTQLINGLRDISCLETAQNYVCPSKFLEKQIIKHPLICRTV